MPRAARKQRPTKPKGKIDERARVAAILRGLDELYPDAHCELDYSSAFELLCATILSAQCTDKRVNLVTPNLFAKYPDAQALADADAKTLQGIIQSTGFFRNKAKNLMGAARVIVEDFDGRVPETMDELLTLPGVARKTANVVLGTAFGKNEGFVVDTHIGRLSQRLALTRETDPQKIERDLCEKIPLERWTRTGHQLIWHGRRVCYARGPECEKCALAPHCPSAGKV